MSASVPSEPPIPKRYPAYFNAGTTVKIDRMFPGWSAADFTYQLLLAGAGTLTKSATADADGITWHLVLSPTDTAPLNTTARPSPYSYVERLTDATTGEVYDVASGRIMVNANLASVGAGDMITFEEKTLAALESVLQGRITADIEQYAIAGRSITKIPVRELLQLRGQYRAIVWKQRNPGKLMSPIEVAFPTIAFGPYPYSERWTDAAN